MAMCRREIGSHRQIADAEELRARQPLQHLVRAGLDTEVLSSTAGVAACHLRGPLLGLTKLETIMWQDVFRECFNAEAPAKTIAANGRFLLWPDASGHSYAFGNSQSHGQGHHTCRSRSDTPDVHSALLAAVAILTAGCGSRVGDTTDVAASCADTSGPTVKVGAINSLSGGLAVSESVIHDAITMAVEEINSGGGVLGKQLQLDL